LSNGETPEWFTLGSFWAGRVFASVQVSQVNARSSPIGITFIELEIEGESRDFTGKTSERSVGRVDPVLSEDSWGSLVG